MECDLNGFQSIRYVNGHVDILYSYNVSFAIQYIKKVHQTGRGLLVGEKEIHYVGFIVHVSTDSIGPSVEG